MEDRTTPEKPKERDTEWYRTIVEEVNDLATVVDSDGTITYVSPAITRVLGYEPEDLIGHQGYGFVHSDNQDRNAEAMESVLEDGSNAESVEVRFRDAKGSWRWIEATIRNRLDDGVIDGVLLSSRDITTRKATRRRLESSPRARASGRRNSHRSPPMVRSRNSWVSLGT
ncbi:PAS domain S-box protein [Halorubellus litoreus]|uniref:histidine kinase n=1 Tax=Halorubellus litoreus TaxID=755308 RepID=A0ABD5VLR0_9EURY